MHFLVCSSGGPRKEKWSKGETGGRWLAHTPIDARQAERTLNMAGRWTEAGSWWDRAEGRTKIEIVAGLWRCFSVARGTRIALRSAGRAGWRVGPQERANNGCGQWGDGLRACWLMSAEGRRVSSVPVTFPAF